MDRRTRRDWVVLASFENGERNRCVDLFVRRDGTYGFAEFRRDPEDAGAWTPVEAHAGLRFASRGEAEDVARQTVGWLRAV